MTPRRTSQEFCGHPPPAHLGMRLHPAWLAAIVIVASLAVPMLAPADAAAGPNPRPPLVTMAPVLQMAMAPTGTMLAVTDDPGTRLPTPGNAGPDVPTWYLWNRDGLLVHSGTADVVGCASRVGDICQSPTVAAALSSDGSMFAVASNVATSPLDATRALLLIGHVSDASLVRYSLPNPVTAIALDRHGGTVAVLERVPAAAGTGQPDKSQVDLLSFDGATLTAVFPAYAIAAPAAALALADDGARLAVAADHLYVFTHSTAAPTVNSDVAGAVNSVAVTGAPPHTVLAGYASGTLAIFDDAGGATARASLPLAAPVNAVATDGIRGYAADAAGKVHSFDVGTAAPFLARLSSRATAPDAASQLALSQDGIVLLLRSATELHLLQSGSANLTELWMQKPATAPVGGGVDHNGDLAAAGVGSGVVAFDASHGVLVDPMDPLHLPPRAARDVDLTYRNAGNRGEAVDLAAWFPANWFMTAQPASFNLSVGQSVIVKVHIVVGDNEKPGTRLLYLNHTLATGGSGTTVIAVDVLERDALALDADGPATLPMKRGETAHFAIKLENRGNTDAHVDLVATLDRSSWTMQVMPRHFDLASGATGKLDVALTAASDAVDGDTGNVHLSLLGRPGSELDVSGVVGARFGPTLAALGRVTVGAGGAVDVNVTIANAGNVADRFRLTLSGILPDGWTAVITGQSPAESRILEPGEAVAFTVHIEVPASGAGQRVQMSLAAASLADPTKTAERGLLVVVGGELVAGHGTPPPTLGLMIALLGMTAALLRRRGPPRR